MTEKPLVIYSASQNGTETAIKSAEPSNHSADTAATENNPMEELNQLIGLSGIKKDVTELINLLRAMKLREQRGMKTAPISLHLVFTGNPGTGKTTVARILAQIYKEIGILEKGQLVEVDRADLVAGYVGQTAIKTKEKINEALGGILFIDEAYTLAKESGNDFGQEAIDTILKAMEDMRDKFIVIVAGYTKQMSAFISSNPGLKSRFNKFFEFPDYSAEELLEIFKRICTKYDYKLSEAALKKATTVITAIEKNKGPEFANGREIRNMFERIISNQAMRLATLSNPTEEDISTIEEEDIRIN